MAKLEDLKQGAAIRGILADQVVTVVNVEWIGSDLIDLTFKSATGKHGSELVYRDREPQLEVAERGRPSTVLARARRSQFLSGDVAQP